MFLLIIVSIFGYFLGSINTSILIGKIYGIDIRSKGSGNAGMTNTLRVLGKKAAIFVLLGDAFKGIIAYLIGYYVSGSVIGGILAGGFAVIGHNWPIYFKFKGGKGVLTSISVLFMIDWKISILALCFFIIIVIITRYVSLGSVLTAIIFPILVVFMNYSLEFLILSIILCLMTIIKHKLNIQRLLKGTESKLGSKKKKEEDVV